MIGLEVIGLEVIGRDARPRCSAAMIGRDDRPKIYRKILFLN
jgi:hypothetical protein